MLRSFVLATVLLSLVMVGCAVPLARQSDWGVRQVDAQRADLEDLRDRLGQAARSQAYSQPLRDRARREATVLQDRLSAGDFRVGDRVLLWVEGEEELSDTFVVTPERTVILPTVGEVELAGLLRSELDIRIASEVGRYITEPTLRTTSMVRIAFIGSFAEEGFYLVPAEMPLSDALMTFPGLGGEGDVSKVRIERGDEILMRGTTLRDALLDGATIGELMLYSGDVVSIPRRSIFAPGEIGSTIGIAATIVFALDRLFRNN
jgi:protein involved in polysaccharide export with SLBB domain